jgi:hypothetical protein
MFRWLVRALDVIDDVPTYEIESVVSLDPEHPMESAIVELDHRNNDLRQGIRDLLMTNSVIVPEEETDDTLLRVMRDVFGHPPLAEQLLRAAKRTGAVTAYRDLIDEGVRVRVAVTRRDRQPWVQGPANGPETIEMDADGTTIVERKIDPEYAARPPLPPEPEYEYSTLGELLPRREGESGWSTFLEDGTPPPAVGSAQLGLRPVGGVDPRQPHFFVASEDPRVCRVCRLPFEVSQHRIEGTTP